MKMPVLRNVFATIVVAACMPAFAGVVPNETLVLPGDSFYPESLAQDNKSGKMFSGSFSNGDIVQFTHGKATVFVPGSRDDIHSVVGIAIDSVKRRLWLCNSEAGASSKSTPETVGKAFVHVYNVDSGQLLKKIPLSGDGGHFCNDIALSRDGSAYITDSFSPIIWKISTNLVPQAWLVSDQFKGEGFNLNGIQLSPDEKYLLVNKTNTGKVFRVDVQNKSVLDVRLDRPIEGGDGMQLVSSHVLLMVEGFGAKEPGIARLVFNTDYTAAKIEDKVISPAFETPTAVRQIGEMVYVVNSRFNHLFKRDTYGPAVGPFNIMGFRQNKSFHAGAF